MNQNQAAIAALERGPAGWREWRAQADQRLDLSGIDLAHRSLIGFDFHNISFTDARITGATISYSTFYLCDFEQADLSNTEAKGAIFTDCSLRFAQLQNARLVGANLSGAILSGANLTGADLCVANLSGANLRHTVLDKTKVWDTAFCNVDLSAVSLIDLDYQGPCDIGAMTIEQTALTLNGDGPAQANFEFFLRGCGIKDHWLELFRSLVGSPIQWYSAFISYSREDKAFARRLYDQLQGQGIRCWLDEETLHPGERILDCVNEAIRVHDRLLLCCSRASLSSWWVKDEILKAIERERRAATDVIVPIDLDGFLLNEWEDGLAATIRARSAADFTGWDRDNTVFERQLRRLVTALKPKRSLLELRLPAL